MNIITKETRRESYDNIKDGLGEKQRLVYNSLKNFEDGISAKELAIHMHNLGLVGSPERNSVHPRLNELVSKGLVKIDGKKVCSFTNRKVAIYKIR